VSVAGAPDGLAAALAGRFELRRELGRGGMGIVYLARETTLDRDVALKVLPPDLAARGDLKARFLREARTAAQLSHPNIVPVHAADDVQGFAYFAMGLVDGETLAQRIAVQGKLGPAEVVRILRDTAWALAYAHARGVVHRDVKPENIMLERGTGRVMVADFGIARREHDAALTQDGEMLGTVHYMSPELIGGTAVDGRSDLYALGVVGFRLLSGRLPFDDAAPSAVLVAHATRPAPLLASVAADVPAALAAVIDRCLRKDPADRFATGEALAEALGAALDGAGQAIFASNATPLPQVLTTEQAEAIWLRAAQLQMDAATSIRQRTRDVAPTAAGGMPTSGYRLQDVESAAAEVGIGKEYVQLALAELPSQNANAPVVSEQEDARMTTVLGTSQRSIRVAHVVEAPAAQVLEALGRIVQAQPYDLSLLDTIGGHPLDGGVLSFAVPKSMLTVQQTVNMFAYRMHQLELMQLSIALHALPGSPARTEIVLTADLRPGARKNVTVAHWISWSLGGTLGGGGTVIALAKGAALVAGGLVLGTGALVLGMYGLYRGSYRGAVKEGEKQLGEMLRQVGASIRSQAVFGVPLPPRRPPPPSGGDDGFTLLVS